MNLRYTDVEDELRASVRGLLDDRCRPAQVVSRCDSDQPHDRPLWTALARDLGLAGLLVPEDRGGAGASAREAAVVLEELGRSVAPVPFLTSAVLATELLRAGNDPAVERLATAAATAVVAIPLSHAPTAAFPAAVQAAGGRLSGRVTSVADAELADLLVVPVAGPDNPQLRLVDARADGVRVTPRISLDPTRRLSDVELTDVADARPVDTAQPTRALAAALRCAAGLLASEQVGVAQWCLDATVAYLGERRQFGRVLGSFQALKHRLAELWLEVGSARAAARYAADALATGSADAPVAVAVAQSYCAEVAVHAAEECIQLHGGIGMTWEHPAHLYLKRAKASELAFGTPGRHRADLARLVDLPPAG